MNVSSLGSAVYTHSHGKDEFEGFNENSFAEIDKESASKDGFSTSISSKGQFLLNIQVYASGLDEDQRNLFVSGIEKTSSHIFEVNFLNSLKNPNSSPVIDEERSIVTRQLNIDPNGELGPDQQVLVGLGGPISEYSRSVKTHGFDNSYRVSLKEKLDELSLSSASELSKQDALTMRATFEKAIFGVTNQQSDWYSMLNSYHGIDLANQATESLPLSMELKSKYGSLLSDIKSAIFATTQQEISKLEQSLSTATQYRSTTEEAIEMMKEGLSVSRKFGAFLTSNDNRMEGSDEFFMQLINDSKLIDRPSSDDFKGTINWLAEKTAHFQKQSIDHDFSAATTVERSNEASDFNASKAESLSNQFINAINSYLEVSRLTN